MVSQILHDKECCDNLGSSSFTDFCCLPIPSPQSPIWGSGFHQRRKGLDTAQISHFPSSQWSEHNSLETRHSKLTQKSSCQGREEPIPFILRPREKPGNWHLNRIRNQCEHRLARNSFSYFSHLLKSHGAHAERKLDKHLWKQVPST